MLEQTGIKTFEIVQYVTGPLEGSIDDWPSHIQDIVFAALEKKAQEVELPLKIVHSRCDVDYADKEGGKDRYYLHTVASEIVAADSRFVNASPEELKATIADMIAGRTKY